MARKTTVVLPAETLPDYAARHNTGTNGHASAAADTTAPALLELALTDICPRPGFNPRKTFDETALVGLAESIQQQGILQPITVRSVTPIPHSLSIAPANEAIQLWGVFNDQLGQCVEQVTGAEAAKARAKQLSECRYHIVMGERRWRASGLAGKTTIPAIVTDGLGEGEYKVRAILENIQRENLDPIEEAAGYRELAGFGYTQEQIGEMVGRGQTGIAKALRLLKLPDDVQALLRTGALHIAHGLALLRFERYPAIMSRMAQEAAGTQASSKSLEKGVPFTDSLKHAKLVIPLRTYEAKFNIEAVCPNCPFDAYRKGSQPYDPPICLNPAHYNDLQKEAQDALQQKLKDASTQSRTRAKEALAEAEAAQAQATTREQQKEAARALEAAHKAVKTIKGGLPHLRNLDYGTYAEIKAEGCPPECTSACPCRSQAQNYSDKIVDICVDPGRLNRFKAAHSRDEQKERRARFEALTTEVQNRLPELAASRALALIAYDALTSQKTGLAECKRAIVLPPSASPRIAALMDGKQNYSQKGADWDALAALPAATLIHILTEVRLRQEMAYALDVKSDSLPQTRWWLGLGMETDRARLKDGREGVVTRIQGNYVWVLVDGTAAPEMADCAGVTFLANTGLADTGQANPDGQIIGQEDADGSDEADHLECLRCGDDLPEGIFAEALMGEISAPVRMSTGELLTPHAATYCATCAPGVALCRDCGCTDEAGCPEGCTWVEDDLCSVCASTSPTPESEQSRSFDDALRVMLTSTPGATTFWEALKQSGADDRLLRDSIAENLGEFTSPQGASFTFGPVTLAGRALTAYVRTLMDIPAQLPIAEVDAAKERAI